MEFVENSDKALAALEKRDNAKQESNEVNHNHDHNDDDNSNEANHNMMSINEWNGNGFFTRELIPGVGDGETH